MRYYRQRFFLIVLGLALPLVLSLAFLQEPSISRLLLNFTLKIVRFQTGLKVNVSNWSVQPFTFSVTFKEFSLPEKSWSFSAEELQFQFSPLYLAIGRVHLKNFRAKGARILSNQRVFSSAKGSEKEESFDLYSFPNKLSSEFAKVHDDLLLSKLSFEDLNLDSLRLSMGDLSLQFPELQFQGLGRGQFRVTVKAESLVSPGNFEVLDSIEMSALLMKLDRENHFLALRRLIVHQRSEDPPLLTMHGRVPGNLRFQFNADLVRLNAFLKSSPILESLNPQMFMSGALNVEGNADLTSKKSQKFSAVVEGKDLKLDIFHPNDLRFEVDSDFVSTRVTKMSLHLPQSRWEKRKLKNRIEAKEIVLGKEGIRGQVQVSQASLCGILWASGVDECFVDLETSGTVDLKGVLENFELEAYPQLRIEAADTYGEPRTLTKKESAFIVRSKPTMLTGLARVSERYVDFDSLQLAWGENNVATTSGRIVYVPAVVDLQVHVSQLNLKDAIENFLGIELAGYMNAESRIFYKLAEEPINRTKVSSTVTIGDTEVMGQSLGELKGNFEYLRKRLRVGPLSVSQGGGIAHVLGNLYSKGERGSWLDLDCVFDQYEWGFKSGSGAVPVHGVWSGSANMRGYLNGEDAGAFRGPLDLTGKNARSFGIPFETVFLKSDVGLVYLDIKKLIAQKGKADLTLSGFISESKSNIKFSSSPMPISALGYLPSVESIVSGGNFTSRGFWSSGGDWKVDADLKNVKIGTLLFPSWKMEVGGNDVYLDSKLSMGDDANLSLRAIWDEGNLRLSSTKGLLSGRSTYLVLAYVNQWTLPQPVRTNGLLEFDWTRGKGFIRSKDFRIFGPKGSDSVETLLLDAPGEQRMSWLNGKAQSGDLRWKGDKNFSIRGDEASGKFELSGDLSGPLVDLFLPDLFHFLDGSFHISQGSMEAPPMLRNINMQSEAKGLSVALPILGQPILETQGQVTIRDSLLKMQGISGKLGTGSIDLEGQYRIDFESEGILLRTNMNKARVVLMEEYPMTIDGNLLLTGDSRPYSLTGTVDIQEGLYSSEFAGVSSGLILGDQDHDVELNVRANVLSGFLVKNSLISTRLNGTLFLLGNNLDPRMQGVLYMDGGALYARDNTFTIGQGTLSFSKKDSNIPLVSLQASTDLRYNSENYKINLLASGKATDLKLDFSSEPALSTQDTISLLTFGFIRSDVESSTTNAESRSLIQSAGVEAFHAIFGKKIGANINRTTGFNVNLTTKVDAEDEEAKTRVEVMRKLGEKTTAIFGRSLDVNNPENNVQVDYRLLKNMNLSGVYESPEPGEQSVGADIRFKFDLK